MWEELQKVTSLMYVAFPIIAFKPSPETVLPDKWELNKTYELKLYFLNFIPFGKHFIEIVTIDHENKYILSNETGFLAKKWNHLLELKKINTAKISYTDTIEIEAGLLSPFVWGFSHMFYRHRQKRWKHKLKK